jgi:hypothetical protein
MPAITDDAAKRHVLDMYARGLAIRTIERETGHTYGSLHTLFKNEGVLRARGGARRPLSTRDVRRIIDTYAGGASLQETAGESGQTLRVVRTILRAEGILRGVGRPPGPQGVDSRRAMSMQALAQGANARLLIAMREVYPEARTQRELEGLGRVTNHRAWRTLQAAQRIRLVRRQERPPGCKGLARYEWVLTDTGVTFVSTLAAVRSDVFQNQ